MNSRSVTRVLVTYLSSRAHRITRWSLEGIYYGVLHKPVHLTLLLAAKNEPGEPRYFDSRLSFVHDPNWFQRIAAASRRDEKYLSILYGTNAETKNPQMRIGGISALANILLIRYETLIYKHYMIIIFYFSSKTAYYKNSIFFWFYWFFEYKTATHLW